jgi:hypothetical protein
MWINGAIRCGLLRRPYPHPSKDFLDYQNKTSEGLGELTGTGLNYVKGMLQDPFTTKNLPSLGINAGETYQDAYMRRLQPQIQQSRDKLQQA